MNYLLVVCVAVLAQSFLTSGFGLTRTSTLGLRATSAFKLTTPTIQGRIDSALAMGGGFGAKLVVKDGPDLPDMGSECKCGSSKKYGDCCGPYHVGEKKPDTVVEMVRSRFSALANNHPSYMQDTTHPSNKEYVPEDRKGKRSKWRKSLEQFARVYDFVSLEFVDENSQSISLSGKAEGDTAEVEFIAKLQPADYPDRVPEMMKELSTFTVKNGEWLYSAGAIKNDFDVTLRPVKEEKSKKMVTTRKIGVAGNN
jgi:SEC-C motif-containing protein